MIARATDSRMTLGECRNAASRVPRVCSTDIYFNDNRLAQRRNRSRELRAIDIDQRERVELTTLCDIDEYPFARTKKKAAPPNNSRCLL